MLQTHVRPTRWRLREWTSRSCPTLLGPHSLPPRTSCHCSRRAFARVRLASDQALSEYRAVAEHTSVDMSGGDVDYGARTPFLAAVTAVFDRDAEALEAALTAAPGVMRDDDNSWPLLLHIVDDGWQEGMRVYAAAGGSFDVRSVDFVARLPGGRRVAKVGGQTILHVVAARAGTTAAELAALAHDFPAADAPDANGRTPQWYLGAAAAAEAEADTVFARVAAARGISALVVAAPAPLAFEPPKPAAPGMRSFTAPAELCAAVLAGAAGLPARAPNSMHRYGKVLLPALADPVYALVRAVLPEAAVRRAYSVHAFYIVYSHALAQTALGRHVDDSTYTINVCLAMSPDCAGSAVVFDGPGGFKYTHAPCRGIVHSGSLEHHVEPLMAGVRENLIIWVKCD